MARIAEVPSKDEAPIACSLSAGEYQLRLAAIEEIGRRAFVAADVRPDGATLSFRNSRAVHASLAAIVRAESECCPFLILEVGERHDLLTLSITGARAALPIVRDLVQRFQRPLPSRSRDGV
jgi:hypothetical protein